MSVLLEFTHLLAWGSGFRVFLCICVLLERAQLQLTSFVADSAAKRSFGSRRAVCNEDYSRDSLQSIVMVYTEAS